MSENIKFTRWISMNSKKALEHLDKESMAIQEALQTAVMILFVDLEDPRYSKQCQDAID